MASAWHQCARTVYSLMNLSLSLRWLGMCWKLNNELMCLRSYTSLHWPSIHAWVFRSIVQCCRIWDHCIVQLSLFSLKHHSLKCYENAQKLWVKHLDKVFKLHIIYDITLLINLSFFLFTIKRHCLIQEMSKKLWKSQIWHLHIAFFLQLGNIYTHICTLNMKGPASSWFI